MIKQLLYFILVAVVTLAFLSCAGMPKSVKQQSRKNAIESETWNKFDKSGEVKFLQVQTTAAHSGTGQGSKLDGSIGERLIEIKVDPDIQDASVEWNLNNKGKSTIWVVGAGESDIKPPILIPLKGAATFQTKLDKDHYTYIVVDSEGGKKADMTIKANCGETDAKTARGKSMRVIWF